MTRPNMHCTGPLLLLVVFLQTPSAVAQCGPYVGHPIWPDTEGTAFVNPNECGDGITTCLWDNGSTAWDATGLSVGMHTVDLYVNGAQVQTLSFEVEQLEWELNQSVFTYVGAVSVSMWAEVPYCGTSIFNYHRCPPDPEQTVVYLLQDGEAIDSLSPVGCLATQHAWSGLPFGYTYQLHLVDHGACGSEAWGAAVQTWSCGGADVALDVQPSMGGTGSIEVLEVMPDPGSINPPAGPLEGTFRLWSLPDYTQVGDEQTGTTAFWDALPPGDYEVLFVPELLCDPVLTPVTIDLVSGLSNRTMDEPVLWPQPAQHMLYWSRSMSGAAHITDLHGRLLLQASSTDRMDISTLAPGIYLLRVEGCKAMRFVKD